MPKRTIWGDRSPSLVARTALLGSALGLVLVDLVTVGGGDLGRHHGSSAGVVATAGPPTTVWSPATDPAAPTTTGSPSTTTAGAPATTVAAPAGRPGQAHVTGTPATSYSGVAPAAPTATTAVAAPSTCAQNCVTISAVQAGAPFTHGSTGLLLLPSATGPSSYQAALAPAMYRSAPVVTSLGTLDWSSWDRDTVPGEQTTIILSNLWFEAHPGGPPPTPWSNWGAYDSFIHNTAIQIVNSGRRVDYWDVYNEPGWRNVYSPADYNAMTPDDLLQQFLHTYQDVMGVDPAAAIVGPSIGHFTVNPVPADDPVTREPDMATFLRFCANNNIKLAAVAWHDDSLDPPGIAWGAQTTWKLIHSLPALGNPAMFVDEFGRAPDQDQPALVAAMLAVAQDEGISSLVRSCWADCSSAALDGLVTPAGAPVSAYWLYRSYAQMAGRVATTSSGDPGIYALAAANSSPRQVTAILGRYSGTAASEPVHVVVEVPWSPSRVSVTLGCDPNQPGAIGGPVPVTADNVTLTPLGGGRSQVSFDVPSFSLGSAYSVTVQSA